MKGLDCKVNLNVLPRSLEIVQEEVGGHAWFLSRERTLLQEYWRVAEKGWVVQSVDREISLKGVTVTQVEVIRTEGTFRRDEGGEAKKCQCP